MSLLWVLVNTGVSAYQDTVKAVVIKVIDGDTFEAKVYWNKNEASVENVRLLCVDTMESTRNKKLKRDAKNLRVSENQLLALGIMAKKFSQEVLYNGRVVLLEFDRIPRDKYGRLLAYVWLDKERTVMFNELLVKNGLARVYIIYPNKKYEGRLRTAETFAKRKQLGIWKILR